MKGHFLTGVMALALAVPAFAEEHAGHGHEGQQTAAASPQASGTITVKGEVLDLVCYIDHDSRGAKHADCAKTCIESGLPVGLKAEDGKVYLLVGEHQPLNKALAALAGKTITVTGKAASRDGLNLLENAQIQP